MAFLLLAALLGLGTLGGSAHAAPSVDTWAAPSPPRVYGQAVVFQDQSRDALIIVDLWNNPRRLWRLPNSGERRWSSFVISGKGFDRPDAVDFWAYDPANDRLLIIGAGEDPSVVCCSDTMRYRQFLLAQELTLGDTATVRAFPTAGPLPLRYSGFSTALDSRRNRLILTGGEGSSGNVSEVLAFDLGANPHWSLTQPPGAPLNRRWGQALVDSLTDRLYYVGGYDQTDRSREVWFRDLAGDGAWQQVSVPDSLPRLAEGGGSHQSVLDAVGRRIVRFAGEYKESAPDSFGVWSYDLRNGMGWTREPTWGSLPRARVDASVAFDPIRNRLSVYGGYSDRDDLYDSRRYDLFEYAPSSGWKVIEQTGESREFAAGPTVVVDRSNKRAVVFGSTNYYSPRPLEPITVGFGPGLGHDWEYTPIFSYQGGPMAREFASAAWDDPTQRGILYGGRITGSELGDVWQWRPVPWPASPWTRLLPGGEVPPPRWGAASIYDPVRRRLVVFGGNSGAPTQDLWALSLAGTPRWTRISARGIPPSARFCASAVYDSRRDGMIVYGGNAGSEQSPVPMRDAWFLSFADGDAWIPLDTQGAIPLGRWMHGAMYDPLRDRMLVLWGRDATGGRFDCATLELSGMPTWHEYTPAGPAPPSRWGLAVVYDEQADRALIIGGADNSRYGDPTANWLIEFAPGAPLPPAGRPLAYLGFTPNPTRGSLDAVFDLPTTQAVTARIFDARGRLVRDLGTRTYGPGRHTFHWDGMGEDGYRPRPGVYFMRVALGTSETTSKVVLLR